MECTTRGYCVPSHPTFHASHPLQDLFIHYSHSGDVFSWEGIGGIADKETGFSHSPEEKENNSRNSRQCRQSC